MTAIFCLVWNIFVFGGTAYLVGWQDWSPWWFALAVVLVLTPSSSNPET